MTDSDSEELMCPEEDKPIHARKICRKLSQQYIHQQSQQHKHQRQQQKPQKQQQQRQKQQQHQEQEQQQQQYRQQRQLRPCVVCGKDRFCEEECIVYKLNWDFSVEFLHTLMVYLARKEQPKEKIQCKFCNLHCEGRCIFAPEDEGHVKKMSDDELKKFLLQFEVEERQQKQQEQKQLQKDEDNQKNKKQKLTRQQRKCVNECEEKWTCNRCTFINDENTKQCSICNTRASQRIRKKAKNNDLKEDEDVEAEMCDDGKGDERFEDGYICGGGEVEEWVEMEDRE